VIFMSPAPFEVQLAVRPYRVACTPSFVFGLVKAYRTSPAPHNNVLPAIERVRHGSVADRRCKSRVPQDVAILRIERNEIRAKDVSNQFRYTASADVDNAGRQDDRCYDVFLLAKR
jgi:hypothetical protein